MMPYESNTDLPDNVKNVLPVHAQDIYKAAFNNALQQYKAKSSHGGDATCEETAHRVAWHAVKRKYQKGEDGHWYPKSQS